jgi:hypothetical protein
LRNLGKIYAKLGEQDRAQILLERALFFEPENRIVLTLNMRIRQFNPVSDGELALR